MFVHTFNSDGWETIERLWAVPWGPAIHRRLCVTPELRLRLLVAWFEVRSATGCINYGGRTALAVQRVQAFGKKGQTIQLLQSVPFPL